MRRQICLVTSAVDLGNLSVEHHLFWVLEQFAIVDHFHFAPNQLNLHTKSVEPLLETRVKRIFRAPELNQSLWRAKRNFVPILIYSLNTATHALPFVTMFPSSFSVMLEWTRTFRADFFGERSNDKANMILWLQQQVLSKAHKVLSPTEACVEHLHRQYLVPQSKLTKVLMPINLDAFSPSQILLADPDEKMKVLFIGGDLIRKGGDSLLDWYNKRGCQSCNLTVVTKSPKPANINPEIRWETEVHSSELLQLLRTHHVLCLPSRWDSFGMIIGEAAAAGLAVVASRNALGSAEIIDDGISGIISESPEECMLALDHLSGRKELVHQMRLAARKLMVERYAPNRVFDLIADALPSNVAMP